MFLTGKYKAKKYIALVCGVLCEKACTHLASLSMLTVRVVVLEYSQLIYIKRLSYNLVGCEFGDF